jgi:hypothetical protein
MRVPHVVASAMMALLLVTIVTTSIAQQQGYYVLDGFGGVHAGGGAPAIMPLTPYFGFDIAKDVVYVPRGSQGKDGILVLDGFGGVHAGGAIKGDPMGPGTPYFGFNVARGIASRSVGVTGYERVGSQCMNMTTGISQGRRQALMTCPGAKKVTGGGVEFFSDSMCSAPIFPFGFDTVTEFSGPSGEGAWYVGLDNNSNSQFWAKFYAICVNAD